MVTGYVNDCETPIVPVTEPQTASRNETGVSHSSWSSTRSPHYRNVPTKYSFAGVRSHIYYAMHFWVSFSHSTTPMSLARVSTLYCCRWIWVAPVLALGCCSQVIVRGSTLGLAVLLVLASTAFWPAHPYWPAFVHSSIWDCWRRCSLLASVSL